MKDQDKNIVYGLGVAALLFLLFQSAGMIVKKYSDVSAAAAKLIKSFEGFRSSPYWDVSRWSWGYGTPAPGSTGYINTKQALKELESFNVYNFEYLNRFITVPLTVNQWSALLSFAYNLGPGNARKLVSNINSKDLAGLGQQWNQYIYSGGAVNPDLVERRKKEFSLFAS